MPTFKITTLMTAVRYDYYEIDASTEEEAINLIMNGEADAYDHEVVEDANSLEIVDVFNPARPIVKDEDKMVTKCYCGHTSYCDCGPLPEEDEVDDNGFPSMDGGRPSSLDDHSSEILKSNPIKK